MHTNCAESHCRVCLPIVQLFGLKSMEVAFRFDTVPCPLSASCFGVMTITGKGKCICASPLSSSCLFLWPFEIDMPCSTPHFAAQCVMMMMMHIFRRLWLDENIYTLSYNYLVLLSNFHVSLTLSVSASAPVLLFVINPPLPPSLRLPSSFYLLSPHQPSVFLCISPLFPHSLPLPHSPSFFLSLALSLLFW